ncbi:TPA: hypothetical protein N0F65_002686 [Lagenidium giganteum]|uniref:Uncharacterized protein n=1 Tax=Lagenidium giganteum TaxID=4803 RepID=A0AAV2Z162_9STRA|nr:TPA: hypothetical protein N0F65_002686 [Lagenidium giganteum]
MRFTWTTKTSGYGGSISLGANQDSYFHLPKRLMTWYNEWRKNFPTILMS